MSSSCRSSVSANHFHMFRLSTTSGVIGLNRELHLIRSRSRRMAVLLTLCIVGVATESACGGGSESTSPVSPPPPPPPPPPPAPPPAGVVNSITLDYTTPLLARGQMLQLQPTLRDAAGNVLAARAIAWSSSDPSVALVGASAPTGNLTAGSAGSTTITATVDGKSATAAVTVIAIASIATGPKVSCAITTEGKLYCAGDGYGSRAQWVSPTLRFSAVSSSGQGSGGTAQTCALATDGSAYCWGANTNGQLGVGDYGIRTAPTKMVGELRFATISVGRDHACGLTSGGDAYCWGDNLFGELGGGPPVSAAPIAVEGGLKFTQLEAGSGSTCGITTAGRAYCWGRNDLGQLGGGGIGGQSAAPVAVGPPLATLAMKQIVTRGPKTCGITSDGKAYCWGNNTALELGADSSVDCGDGKPCSPVPLAVKTSAAFKLLAASQFATCGLTSASEMLCWGMDYENLFGISGLKGFCRSLPYVCTSTPVSGPSGFLTLSGSNSNHCGIKSDGVAYCWGGNVFGQRGWGGSTPDPVPGPFSIAPDAAR